MTRTHQAKSTFPHVYGIQGSGDSVVRSNPGPCTEKLVYRDNLDTVQRPSR